MPVCRVLDLCPGTYYGRKRRPPSARARRDAELLEQIKQIHAENYRVCGARRVRRHLRRQGVQVARCTVERLMRTGGIEGVRRGARVCTTTVDEAAPRPPDLVNRRFTAERPDQLWLADITYVRTWEGWVSTSAPTPSTGYPWRSPPARRECTRSRASAGGLNRAPR